MALWICIRLKRTDDRYIYTVYGEDHPNFPYELFRGSWGYLPDNETALFVASPIGNRMDGRMGKMNL